LVFVALQTIAKQKESFSFILHAANKKIGACIITTFFKTKIKFLHFTLPTNNLVLQAFCKTKRKFLHFTHYKKKE
jgi:hypothetical protein